MNLIRMDPNKSLKYNMFVPHRPKSSDADSTKSIYLAENLDPKEMQEKNLYFEVKTSLFLQCSQQTVFLMIVNIFTTQRQTFPYKKQKL